VPTASGFGLGLAASVAGLLLVPYAVLNATVSSLSGRVINRWGARGPLVTGCVIAVIAFVLLAVVHGSVLALILGSLVLAIGVGLSYPAMPTLILGAVGKDETTEATGVNTIMRNAGAAAGSAVAGTILAAHTGANGVPTEWGFVVAFLTAAVVSAVAVVTGVFIPSSVARTGRSRS
jgi:MFS family permease